MGHRERHRQWLAWLSGPAVNTIKAVGSHCICAVWILLAWHAKSLFATVISVFCLLYTEKTSHGAELAASTALLQEWGQGVGEPEHSEDNPPPLRQRSCHGCPCHPSHPASELPPSACKLFMRGFNPSPSNLINQKTRARPLNHHLLKSLSCISSKRENEMNGNNKSLNQMFLQEKSEIHLNCGENYLLSQRHNEIEETEPQSSSHHVALGNFSVTMLL